MIRIVKNKNILIIVRGLDKDRFFKNHSLEEWDILSIVEFVRKIKNLRKIKYNRLVVGYYDLRDKNLQYPVKLFFLLLQANKKYFIDNQNNVEYFSFWRFIFIDTPLFIGELGFGSLLVLFSWLGLFIFNLLPTRKGLPRPDKSGLAMTEGDRIRSGILGKIIYLRTDNFHGLQQGGSFTHLREVIKELDKLSYTVHYLGSGRIEVPNLDFLQDIIPYPNKFNFPEIPEIYYNWRFISKAYKIIKRQKPLFIYQRHSIFNACGVILSYLTKIPLILEYNGSEAWIRQKWGGLLIFRKLCYFFENICLKKADLISVVSEPIKDELLKQEIPGNKILVNFNGVDSEKFNPDIDGAKIRKKLGIENKIVISTLSTFDVWHGTKVFSQAVKLTILQCNNLAIHFLFIGDGVLRSECERIIQESGMENYVTFIGTVPFTEVQKYLAACDILVASHIPNLDGTPFFGSPTKLFEYMAMGKGIVASDLDQIGQVLEHKKTAWLVKPGDVSDLVNGILQLSQDRELRETLGKNARKEVVKKYTWEQNAKRVMNNYSKII